MQFSAAMLLEMSHLIRDKKRLILETSRVVEIGGKVVLCDLTLRRRLSAKEIVERQDDIRLLETCFGKARLEPLESYIPLFESSGLKDIEILDLSNQVTPTIECWRDNVKNNRRELSEFVSDDHVERFIRSCEILEEYFKSDVWGYGYIIGEKQMHVDVNFDSMDMQQRLF
jgi:27-O-demethylrifamycin SV methyltransferase